MPKAACRCGLIPTTGQATALIPSPPSRWTTLAMCHHLNCTFYCTPLTNQARSQRQRRAEEKLGESAPCKLNCKLLDFENTNFKPTGNAIGTCGADSKCFA